MDGSLLDLTAEMVESELEDYWHELFKVQKMLLVKLKKAKAETSSKRRKSISCETKQATQSQLNIPIPANSENTLAFISSVQERMKKFKVSVSDVNKTFLFKIKSNTKTLIFVLK